MSELSITEINKTKFINNFKKESFLKLLKYTRSKPDVLDLAFFTNATLKAESDKCLMGLIYISILYKNLDCLIEAEYILSLAYKIDKLDKVLIYNLIDVYCSRQNIHYANYFIQELVKTGDELLILKSNIKSVLVSGLYENIETEIIGKFEIYKKDEEFMYLVLDFIDRTNNISLLISLFSTKYSIPLYKDLHMRDKTKYKKMAIRRFCNILIENLI